MKRDFALRIDCLLTGVRASLDSLASYMKNSVDKGTISEEEFKKLVKFIGTSMGETIKMSNELYHLFPDIIPDELKSDPSPKGP
jgi:hypothetical protein